jgi:hypothetical protein
MKGFTVFIVLVALVIVGFLVFRNSTSSPTTQDQISDSALSDISTKDENIDGSKEFNLEKSEANWTGSKKLITTWIDKGTIKIKSGNALFDNGALVGGMVVFDMKSIVAVSTGKGDGQDKLSEHLRSDDFFGVEKYPETKFVITSAEHVAGDTYMLTGDLTVKQTTAPATFPVEVVTTNGIVAIEGTATIDRTIYDVRFGSEKFFEGLGDNIVNDEFTLNFKVVTK